MDNSEIIGALEDALEVINSFDGSAKLRIAAAYDEAFHWIDWRQFPSELQSSFDLDALWAYMADADTTEEQASWVIEELEALHERLQSQ
jgi:hypothetical protein